MNTESQTDRITQLEAACAAMREALGYCRLYNHDGPNDEHGSHYNQLCDYCNRIDQALSTDSGKALLDRLQKAEGEVEKWQGEFDTVRDLLHQSQDRRQAVEKERDRFRDERNIAEGMAGQNDLELRQIKSERDRYKSALESVVRFPVHSEPVGAAYAMQDLATEALQPAQKDAPEKGTK